MEVVSWKCYGTKDSAVMGFVCQHMALVCHLFRPVTDYRSISLLTG